MARPKYNAKPDSNQAGDIADLSRLGFEAFVTAQWSPVGDFLLWGYDVRLLMNRLTWWEWKTEEGELTPTQLEFMLQHPGFVLLGRCVEDVLIEYGRLHGCTEGD